MLNDDYTPMEFVVLVLQMFFQMGIEDATRVMLHVHQRGVGVCGIFTYEVAETKVSQVIDFARETSTRSSALSRECSSPASSRRRPGSRLACREYSAEIPAAPGDFLVRFRQPGHFETGAVDEVGFGDTSLFSRRAPATGRRRSVR